MGVRGGSPRTSFLRLLALAVAVVSLAGPWAAIAAAEDATGGTASPSPAPTAPGDATGGTDVTTGTDVSTGSDPEAASTVAADPPACRYADLTAVVDPAAPHLTLLDTAVALKRGYVPPDLVPVARAGLAGTGLVRRPVIADLQALDRAARAAGVRLASVSAYRSYGTQIRAFATWRSMVGADRVRLYSARPGHSEHQLGTTIDFGTYGGPRPWDIRDWARTRAGAWMAANGWEYGFVMTYPKSGSPGISCYAYEPWHWRWVGREAARAMHDEAVVPRVWLWRRSLGPR